MCFPSCNLKRRGSSIPHVYNLLMTFLYKIRRCRLVRLTVTITFPEGKLVDARWFCQHCKLLKSRLSTHRQCTSRGDWRTRLPVHAKELWSGTSEYAQAMYQQGRLAYSPPCSRQGAVVGYVWVRTGNVPAGETGVLGSLFTPRSCGRVRLGTHRQCTSRGDWRTRLPVHAKELWSGTSGYAQAMYQQGRLAYSPPCSRQGAVVGYVWVRTGNVPAGETGVLASLFMPRSCGRVRLGTHRQCTSRGDWRTRLPVHAKELWSGTSGYAQAMYQQGRLAYSPPCSCQGAVVGYVCKQEYETTTTTCTLNHTKSLNSPMKKTGPTVLLTTLCGSPKPF